MHNPIRDVLQSDNGEAEQLLLPQLRSKCAIIVNRFNFQMTNREWG